MGEGGIEGSADILSLAENESEENGGIQESRKRRRKMERLTVRDFSR
jgi:hypothetical protein